MEVGEQGARLVSLYVRLGRMLKQPRGVTDMGRPTKKRRKARYGAKKGKKEVSEKMAMDACWNIINYCNSLLTKLEDGTYEGSRRD